MLEAASADAAEGMRIAIETDVLAGVIGDAFNYCTDNHHQTS